MTIRCQLDDDGCISLLAVLRIMNQVNQEQTWALAHQVAALMQRLWPAGNCCAIESLGQIHIHRDGFVHQKSLQLGAVAANANATIKLQQQASSTANTSSSCSATSSDEDDDDDDDDLELEEEEEEEDAQDRDQQDLEASENIDSRRRRRRQKQHQKSPATSNLERSQSGANKRAQANTTNKLAPDNCINISNSNSSERQVMPPTPPISPPLGATEQQVAAEQLSALQPATSETELVASLGIALFWALDYGIPDDEERKLSLTMEYLIVQSQNELSLNDLIEICIKRLPGASKQQADLHYREVCKSLIQDTIELSLFLDKIYTASMVLSDFTHLTDDCCPPMATKTNTNNQNKSTTSTKTSSNITSSTINHSTISRISDSTTTKNNNDKCDILNDHHLHHHLDLFDQDELSQLGLPLASLRALKINDWARLWMQVIRELRQLGKFKQ